jgi:hypothetical protein
LSEECRPLKPLAFIHGGGEDNRTEDPFDNPRWDWCDPEDDSPEWEQATGARRCRGGRDRWSYYSCWKLADLDADDGQCSECRGGPPPPRCPHCHSAPPAYADGSCRTCYRWLARNRDRYSPGELVNELAKRVERRVQRAKTKTTNKITRA